MKYLLVPLMIIAFLIISCEETTNTNNSEDVICPLAIDNSWSYNVYFYFISKPDSIFFEHSTTIRITDSKIIDDIDWFKTNESVSDVSPNYYYSNQNDGFYQGIMTQTEQFEDVIETSESLYNYPTFISDVNSKGNTQTTRIDTVITTELGNFKCIKYSSSKYDDSFSDYYRYYSPNIGLIFMEERIIDNTDPKNDTIIKTMILTDYELK